MGRQSGELGQGPGAVRQGVDRMLPRLHGPGSARDALADREVHEVLRGGLRQGRVRGRRRRRRHLPVHVPEGVVHERLQHGRGQRRDGREVSGQADRQRPLGSA